jgi:hypothetical protein
MKSDPVIKAEILHYISAAPTEESLRSLVSWLDIRCQESENNTSVYHQVFARALAALGYSIMETHGLMKTVAETIRSAENYAVTPTEAAWDSLCFDATQSYPFGPGDGCYSIYPAESENHCRTGSGCRSGSGSLMCQGIPAETVMPVIYKAIYPWITGTDDPVISRERHV